MLKGVTEPIEDGVKVEVLDGSAKLLSLMRGPYFTANAIGALLDWGAYVEATSEQRSNDLLKGLPSPQTDAVWVERDGRCGPTHAIKASSSARHAGTPSPGFPVPTSGTAAKQPIARPSAS
jgi:hypothetical protein